MPCRALLHSGPVIGSAAALVLVGLCLLPTADRVFGQTPPTLRPRPFTLTEADRTYWAFQPVRRPAIPQPSARGFRSVHPIDLLVESKLAENGLEPAPPASPRTLVRRAWFDLVGLPPSPETVAAFEKRPTEEAWEQLIDDLLASPQYGERWGRHWLDLVRYAESNGYERDGPKPNAWRYRDYVIRSFNADKPYDAFVREQLAGDEFAEGLTAGSDAWRDAMVATGFFRLHVWDDEPDSTLAAEYDDLDDVMVTIGTAFLGLTVGCARCHDHKFDPVSQADYYSLLSFIRSVDPYGQQHTGGGGRGTGRIERPLVPPELWRRWETEKAGHVSEAERRVQAAPDPEARKQLEEALKKERETPPPFEFALAVAENGPQPKPTHLLARGEAGSPREEVSPAFPAVLGLPEPMLAPRPATAPTTGRRRVLADWVASANHPLTARVIANRLWQHHFGVGIVPTPDDFGRSGLPPTNQPLLDSLASELVAGQWRLKRMHKLIMTSRAYRMSSSADNPRGLATDQDNTSLWHQNLRRLEAEAIRDSLLAISGELNPKAGGPSVFPTLPPEVHGTQDAAGKGWNDSPPEEQNRRSVYLVVKRALKVPLLECFDFANSASPTGTRPVTTTAPQGLMLLNDAFVQSQAAAFAGRVAKEAGSDPDHQIRRAFELAWQRQPTSAERRLAQSLLADQSGKAAAEGATDHARAALQSLCRGLLNASETIYVD